ncbi:MAG: hypothetical protein LBM25_02335 [Bacteroidales bacterium]|jgi:mevalonate pyrophosphate decarboxylase|nr:hypothetical protein [Bacteroidales bacterium]
MKKLFLYATIIMLAFSTSLLVSCSDDFKEEPQNSSTEERGIMHITKEQFAQWVDNADIREAILQSQKDGYTYRVYKDADGNVVYKQKITKEEKKPDFVTSDMYALMKWVAEALENGYDVYISYDEKTKKYSGWLITVGE